MAFPRAGATPGVLLALRRPVSTTTVQAPRPRRRTFVTIASALSVGAAAGFGLALVAPRPQILSLLFPKPTPISPLADSKEGIAESAIVEAGLQDLALVKHYRSLLAPASPTSPATTSLTPLEAQSDTTQAYTESRPYATPAGPHHLTAYTLRGPGKLASAPIVFTRLDKQEAVYFMHLGGGLCGHEGVVHGGLLATVLDETLGRGAFLVLPNHIGVTATLNVAYRKPTFANQYVMIKARCVRAEGRKAWIKGEMYNLEGEVLVEAEGLFVEPKMAKFLNKKLVREALKV